MYDYDDPEFLSATHPYSDPQPPVSIQPSAAAWDSWQNAEHYFAFIEEYPVYRALNHRLVELARIGEARRVLDIACGTGATSLACLARMVAGAHLVGVDIARAMVGVARNRVADDRARFEVARARDLRRVVEGPFDRAVCNAAFWQLADPAALPFDLATLIEPGGLFVFNVPVDRVRGEASDVHPFQLALAYALEKRTGRPLPPASASIDPRSLRGWLDGAGFELIGQERFVYQARQEELLELMKIPAMTAPLAPGLDLEARHDAVVEAGERIDRDQRVEVPWIFFVARRRTEGAAGAGGRGLE